MNDVKQAVLIVGAGGLGVPALMALARGGVNALTLIDPDPVELSNLPRQVIYGELDVGTPKVIAAARYLGAIAPAMRVETYQYELNPANAAGLIGQAAFVLDATDNPATKFLINDTCVATATPFVYGGVVGMSGQAMTVLPRHTACLRCLFEEPPDEDDAASCRDAGIIGPVAGTIGEVQAAQAILWLRGMKPTLAGRILTYDAQAGKARVTAIAPRSQCLCGAAREPIATAMPATR